MLIALQLFALQGVLGAVDTLWYHEWKGRLAWTPRALWELRFHCVRSFIYGLLFSGLAWFEPRGGMAVLTLALLGLEIVLTLGDFVAEDRSRVLQPGERILHTLMAILWGAFLANIVPVLAEDVSAATSLQPHDLGWLSRVLCVFGLGVFAWSIREGLAARRLARPLAPTT